MFKWRITIPAGFTNMSPAEYAANQKKGVAAIEKTYDGKVENHSKPIFVFKSDQMHYLESNYQSFNTKIDGDYLKSCRNVNDMIFNTFKTQMKGVQIDSTYSFQIINNLKFNVFKIVVTFPNSMMLNFYMFNRLFINKDFSVVMMYADKEKGEAMLNAFKKSTFSRR